ncbi:TPA: tRNA cytosine(34) acetyltransferase TmcA, partial [Pluralibacter gergoviae]|nr:tRNA cytosine(34) acetyltransferase TmcA [Pluralibacter gergoviae]
ALASGLPLRLLRATLARQPEAALVQAHGLSGRKALLAALRAEAASALAALDGGRARALAEQVENCNFFN